MLDKAKEHLSSAEILLCEGQYRDAISRAYYAVFSAMYAYVGEPPRGRWEHPALRGIFVRMLGEAGTSTESCRALRRRLRYLYDARIDADYSPVEFDEDTAVSALEIARDVIGLVERNE